MEIAKGSLDDLSGPSRTERAGDDGVIGAPNPPRMSSAPFTVATDSQVTKGLGLIIAALCLQSISHPIYLITFSDRL